MPTTLYAQTGNTAEIVSARQQATGVFDEILGIDPNDGTVLRLLNNVATGDAPGIPIFADFQTPGGAAMVDNSQFRLVLEIAGRPQDLVVSETINNIGAWQRLTLSEQQNKDNIDSIKVELEEPGGDQMVSEVQVRDVDRLRVDMNSSDQFGPANSTFIFSNKAAEIDQL